MPCKTLSSHGIHHVCSKLANLHNRGKEASYMNKHEWYLLSKCSDNAENVLRQDEHQKLYKLLFAGKTLDLTQE